MIDYAFREGSLGTGRSIDVRVADGDAVGRIVRGEMEACEKRGTFRFEPLVGAVTVLGIHRATGARTVLRRLLRPRYSVVHDDESFVLTDRLGENVLYFAVVGEVAGERVDVRQDWDGSVQVTADRAEVGRFRPGSLVRETVVHADADRAAVGSALFGLLVLLPFLHRIYTEETELIEALLD